MDLERKIEKSLKGNGIFITFDGVSWRDKDRALRADSRVEYEDAKFIEVSKKEAAQLLVAALRNDLCYGVKRLGKGAAEEIANAYIDSHHKQARFYTNSDVPYHEKGNAWSFTPISSATIDTGIIVREGSNLASMLWVMDID